MTNKTNSGFPDADALLNNLPLSVITLAPGLYVASLNPAAEQFLGQSQRRLVGRRISDVIGFPGVDLIERLNDSESPLSARDIDMTILGSGQRRVDVTVSPLIDSPDWRLLTFHDNTAVDALGDDSGGANDSILRGPEILAHEIKNPLAGIRGASQLLARKVGKKDRALTDLITSEVDRVANLIEQMQVLSGKTVAPVTPCNLHSIARQAIAVLEAADAQSKNPIIIEEEFDPSLPEVLGNPDRLVQVLINLLSNAREAGRNQKSFRIVLRSRFASGLQLRSAESGKSVRLPIELTVSDNGPGVPPELRDHIFDPFVTTKKSGQGLGLAIVRKLIRDMNGRITHERDEANGWTRFRIHLPMASDRLEMDARGE